MNIEVYGDISDAEAQEYIRYAREKYPRGLNWMRVYADGEMVNIEYGVQAQPFERIRRITGYLVGTLDRWNTAKRAEERDRVKHGVCC